MIEETLNDGEETPELPPVPRGVVAALDELLRRPWAIVERSDSDCRSSLPYLIAGALACFALYGAASGFFQGGQQVLVAAFKVPLIILSSLLLCAPSFYVLSSLTGVEVSPRWLAATVTGLAAMLGLLLVALMPISWLFSVSSTSLVFVTLLHLMVWTVAIYFGYRFLVVAFSARGAERPSRSWLLLFVLVSLQVASQMRPVLWRSEGEQLFAPRKMFFVEQFFRLAATEEEEAPEAKTGGG